MKRDTSQNDTISAEIWYNMIQERGISVTFQVVHNWLQKVSVDKSDFSDAILQEVGKFLYRMRCVNGAAKCWKTGKLYAPNGKCSRMLESHINQYNMIKQEKPSLDDREAFFYIQKKRYLFINNKNKFSSPSEEHFVIDVIEECWANIQKTADILSPLERKELFFQYHLFPSANHLEQIQYQNYLSYNPLYEEHSCPCTLGTTECPYGNRIFESNQKSSEMPLLSGVEPSR